MKLLNNIKALAVPSKYTLNALGTCSKLCIAVCLIWIIQDVILVILDHRQFAFSDICTNPRITATGGRYAHEHCEHHKTNSNFILIKTWISAIYEVHYGKITTIGLALLIINPF